MRITNRTKGFIYGSQEIFYTVTNAFAMKKFTGRGGPTKAPTEPLIIQAEYSWIGIL